MLALAASFSIIIWTALPKYTEFFSIDKPTKTYIIDYLNSAIHSIGVHFYLLLLFLKKWTELKQSLNQAECQFPSDYLRFRKISKTSIVYIILLVMS